jgi:hypothetical protein
MQETNASRSFRTISVVSFIKQESNPVASTHSADAQLQIRNICWVVACLEQFALLKMSLYFWHSVFSPII